MVKAKIIDKKASSQIYIFKYTVLSATSASYHFSMNIKNIFPLTFLLSEMTLPFCLLWIQLILQGQFESHSPHENVPGTSVHSDFSLSSKFQIKKKKAKLVKKITCGFIILEWGRCSQIRPISQIWPHKERSSEVLKHTKNKVKRQSISGKK